MAPAGNNLFLRRRTFKRRLVLMDLGIRIAT